MAARVITSDSDWKYVNVRRLLIFIEASIDRGLQWVVFEPNAEPLWARVRRSIANFLTLVWRNGALEGTKPEEAFFVKCDRTTMTQTDIDSGRLICRGRRRPGETGGVRHRAHRPVDGACRRLMRQGD